MTPDEAIKAFDDFITQMAATAGATTGAAAGLNGGS
jgi:hypothetical protein